jgi:glucokinase
MRGAARILAGDVGGTKTILGLFRWDGARLTTVRQAMYRSLEHPGLSSIVRGFLDGAAEAVDAACFGVPGPVVGGRVPTVNLHWAIDARDVGRETGIAHVELVNDLLATAEGVFALDEHELVTLQEGKRLGVPGNAALVAPGTGLGMAVLARVGDGFVPLASEGGHMDFAPQDEEQIELLRYLQRRFGDHVSVERILSGPGLVNVYEFLRDTGHASELPEVCEQMLELDPGGVIGRAGLSGRCALSVRALDLFAFVLGATAGNLALAALATSGVFLGGGIPPKILEKMTDGRFLAGFLQKGRFRPMLETFPVRVILNERTALLGAAHRAVRAFERAWEPSGEG